MSPLSRSIESSRGISANSITWGLAGLTTIMIACRIVSRAVLTHVFGRDDALIIFAYCYLLAFSISFSIAISKGEGKHLLDIPPEERSEAIRYAVICSSICVQTFAWPKLAIVALLERLLNPLRLTRTILWSNAILLCIVCFINSVLWFEQCQPVAHQWDSRHVSGTCRSPSFIVNWGYAIASYSTFLDLLFALYPPFIIRKLNMPRYQKIFISVSLGGGIIAAAVALRKMFLISELVRAYTSDSTWADVPLLTWVAIEANVLIITACLPTIGPLARFLRGVTVYHFNKSEAFETISSYSENQNGHPSNLMNVSVDGGVMQSRQQGSVGLMTMLREGPETVNRRSPGLWEIWKTVEVVETEQISKPGAKSSPVPHDPSQVGYYEV